MKKILLSIALLGSIFQESSAITVDQVIGACELSVAVAGVSAMYVIYQTNLEEVRKSGAYLLRKMLTNHLGVTTINYEGNAVDVTMLTDEQLLVATGKDKILQYYPLAKRVSLVFCSTAIIYFAAKGIRHFNK